MNNALISEARKIFHNHMLETNTLTLSENNIASNADSSSTLSKSIAFRIIEIISCETAQKINVMNKISGQTLGRQFEMLVTEFLQTTFSQLYNLRPGKWIIQCSGTGIKTSNFSQYEHLAILNALINDNTQLAAALGNDYIIAPDIVICRELYEDSEINLYNCIVDNKSALASDIRNQEGKKPILHASISVKYTMRSDRAQNSRTEALNLIRNRKGRLPHIVVVTAEPLPSRLASLALGTGDIDCLYHFALYELIKAVNEKGSEESIEILNTLINGKRLKDISDLPLDLAI